MDENQAYYERLIRETRIFSLDKETQASAYTKEKNKLMEVVYKYLQAKNEAKYKDAGLEIVATLDRCLKNFDPAKGNFLHYFNAAISQVVKRSAAANESIQQHGPVHIPEQERIYLVKFFKYVELLEKLGRQSSEAQYIAEFARVNKLDPEKLRQMLGNYRATKTVAAVSVNEEGEECSLLDRIAQPGAGPSEELESFAKNQELLTRINKLFLAKQQRQKSLLSKMLTLRMTMVLAEQPRLLEYAQQLEFFDKAVFMAKLRGGTDYTARQIAAELDKTEQSVSRAYKNFYVEFRAIYPR